MRAIMAQCELEASGKGEETIALSIVLCEDNPLRDSIDIAIREAVWKNNDGAAHRMLRGPAEQGDADAQVLLGALFDDGCGTAENHKEAVRLYRKASDQGHPVAQLLLANRYRDGEGVAKSQEKMLELYYKAANQGYATAQYALVAIFYFGSDQPERVEAYKWAKLAALSLKLDPHRTLMESTIEQLEEIMTPEELAEAERLISEWKPKKLYT